MADFDSMVASTAAPAAPQSPTAMIMSLPAATEKKEQANLEDFKKKEQASLATHDELYAKAMKQYNESMSKIGPVSDAKLQDLPDAPNSQLRDPTQALGSLGTILAIFGSMKTRAPMTSALNSMAAAMKGFHQGDQERVKLETAKYQNDFKKALQQNQIEMQRYVQSLEKNKFDMEKAQAEFRVFAIEDGNQTMHDAINAGDYTKQAAILSASLNAGMKGAEFMQKEQDMRERRAQAATAHADSQKMIVTGPDGKPYTMDKRSLPALPQEQQIGAAKFGATGGGNQVAPKTTEEMYKVAEKFGLTPEAFEKAVDRYNQGDPLALPTRNQKNMPLITDIMSRAAEKFPDSSPVVNKIEMSGYKTAFVNTTNREAAVHRITEAVKNLEYRATELNQKLNSTLPGQWPNQTVNELTAQFGNNADLAELKNLMFAVGREYVAATTMPGSNAQMNIGSEKNAEKLANGNMPPAMLAGALKGINADIAATDAALEKERERLHGKMMGINTSGRRSTDAPAGDHPEDIKNILDKYK